MHKHGHCHALITLFDSSIHVHSARSHYLPYRPLVNRSQVTAPIGFGGTAMPTTMTPGRSTCFTSCPPHMARWATWLGLGLHP